MIASGGKDSCQRFDGRVADYERYRPDYPAALLPLVRRELALDPAQVVADVGSGTGKLARWFLAAGHVVHCVEPNPEMRAAGARTLGGFAGYREVAGTAEATDLAPASIHLVAAAQAFHWFRFDEARAEFRRILVPSGHVLLIWNRRTMATPFLRAYEELLLRCSLDYAEVDHRRTTESGALDGFFGRDGFRRAVLPNVQSLDGPGLVGRTLSCSYVPRAGQPRHEELMRGLERLHEEFALDGEVRFEYETEIYWGRPG